MNRYDELNLRIYEYSVEKSNELLDDAYSTYELSLMTEGTDSNKEKGIIAKLKNFVASNMEYLRNLSKSKKQSAKIKRDINRKVSKEWKPFKNRFFKGSDNLVKLWGKLTEEEKMMVIAERDEGAFYDMERIRDRLPDVESVILRKYYEILNADITDKATMEAAIVKWNNMAKKIVNDFWDDPKNIYTRFTIVEFISYAKRLKNTYKEMIESHVRLINHIQIAIDKLFDKYDEIKKKEEAAVKESVFIENDNASSSITSTEVAVVKKVTNVLSSVAETNITKVNHIADTVDKKMDELATSIDKKVKKKGGKLNRNLGK